MAKTITVRLTLKEELLGTASGNKMIHSTYIASKAPKQEMAHEEVESIEEMEKTITVFPKEDGKPFLWDYQIKGFFKDACGMLSRVKDKEQPTKSSELRAYKKVIDGLIFAEPRKIFLNATEISIRPTFKICEHGLGARCERPLRGQTAQGERITLASSETVPAGTTLEFTIHMFDSSYEKYVREWLDYGVWRGIGQWRNSGKGRFTWEELAG